MYAYKYAFKCLFTWEEREADEKCLFRRRQTFFFLFWLSYSHIYNRNKGQRQTQEGRASTPSVADSYLSYLQFVIVVVVVFVVVIVFFIILSVVSPRVLNVHKKAFFSSKS